MTKQVDVLTTVEVADPGARRVRRSAAAPPPSRPDRVARGLATRAEVPLESHAVLAPTELRADPVELLERQAASRVPELVPIRYGRMLVSAFTFYRGAALVMAADLAGTPNTGLRAQLCGDAHLSNFGIFASPERRLIFDVNDFDETLPGPFEWDVKRLAASLEIAGRDNGFKRKERKSVVLAATRSYREAIRTFADQSNLDVWYAHLDVDRELTRIKPLLKPEGARRTERLVAKARTRDNLQAFDKLTTTVDGQARFVSTPPLIVPVTELLTELEATELFARIREPGLVLPPDAVDRPQAPARAVPAGRHGPQGGRRGQRRHAGLDPADGRHRPQRPDHPAGEGGAVLGPRGVRRPQPVREPGPAGGLRPATDAGELGHLPRLAAHQGGRRRRPRLLPPPAARLEGVLPPEQMVPEGMAVYGALCGWTLARAHARSGDRVAIASYLGETDSFDRAIAEFSAAYADLNERDHAALQAAADSGRISVESGV